MNRRGMIGQKLVTGLPGTEITEEFRHLVREYKVGNVILFQRNVESARQLRRLCDEIRELIQNETGLPAFITIDQEGGMINRLCAPMALIPGAMALAATDDPQNAYDAGFLCGKELKRCGVNFNLSPVMDVNNNPQNPIIGARSYGDAPASVARFGCEMVRGLQDAGVYACLKHFPGHGDTAVDSHLGLPCIDKSMDELRQCELIPFSEGIRAGVRGVMTTHILFPQIEKSGVPATMSRTILQGILRDELGFNGLILSDCMMMQAISKHYGTVPGACAAAKAGVDLIFICHDNALTAEACEAIDKELPEEELIASFERIQSAKTALPRSGPEPLEGNEEYLRRVRVMCEDSITRADQLPGPLPELGQNPLFVGCKSMGKALVFNQEADFAYLPDLLKNRLGGDALNLSNEPTSEDCARALSLLPGHSAVVVSTFNAHLHKEQQALLEAIRGAAEVPVLIAALRDPYDLTGWTEKAYCLAAYDYTPDSLRAVCRVLAGEIEPRGKLPIRI